MWLYGSEYGGIPDTCEEALAKVLAHSSIVLACDGKVDDDVLGNLGVELVFAARDLVDIYDRATAE